MTLFRIWGFVWKLFWRMGDGDKGAPFSANNDFVFASFSLRGKKKRGKGAVLVIWNLNFSVKKCLNGMFFLSNRNCTHLNNIRQRVSFNSTWHGIAVFFCSRDWEHNLERFLHNRLINLSFLLCCDRSVNWDLFIYSLLSCITHYRTVQCVCVFVLKADSIYGRKTILFCIFLKREKMTGKGREKKTKLN